MNKSPLNRFKAEFPAKSINEGYARMVAAAFVSQLDPTVADLADIKTAVSEAVTNCIVHAYRDKTDYCPIYITGAYYPDGKTVITVRDKGCGIEDISKAVTPLYTTDTGGERSGMGFTIMESFCDKMTVSSRVGKGTTVRLVKKIVRPQS